MKISTALWTHPDDMPRNVTAAVAGVATGLLGNVAPVVGFAGGLVAQLIEDQNPGLKRVQYITEGVVDGSAALLARALFSRR